MKPLDIQHIGDELAIKWSDGSESFVKLEALRRRCPCAGCQGEIDVMGRLHKGPDRPLTPRSFELTRLHPVGGYGIQPYWADGHSSGIFSFEVLRAWTEAAAKSESGEDPDPCGAEGASRDDGVE